MMNMKFIEKICYFYRKHEFYRKYAILEKSEFWKIWGVKCNPKYNKQICNFYEKIMMQLQMVKLEW